jgi:hypothetical protein
VVEPEPELDTPTLDAVLDEMVEVLGPEQEAEPDPIVEAAMEGATGTVDVQPADWEPNTEMEAEEA